MHPYVLLKDEEVRAEPTWQRVLWAFWQDTKPQIAPDATIRVWWVCARIRWKAPKVDKIKHRVFVCVSCCKEVLSVLSKDEKYKKEKIEIPSVYHFTSLDAASVSIEWEAAICRSGFKSPICNLIGVKAELALTSAALILWFAFPLILFK